MASSPIHERVPPHAYFAVSAVFHYLGPAFAVLLFAHVAPLGVAWLRIVSAALVLAAWRRPWQAVAAMSWPQRRLLLVLGFVLAGMNSVFYLALARLPLSTVGAIEFLGVVGLAALGIRGRRNLIALAIAVAGVAALTNVRLGGEPLGFALAFINCGLFVAYVVVGKRIAGDGGGAGLDRLSAAMVVAAMVAAPVGVGDAVVAFGHPAILAAGFAVGICSSVVPYVCDQLALARLPRATFALMLSLLPATATLVGIVVLAQWPSAIEVAGILAVIGGVALHRPDPSAGPRRRSRDGLRPVRTVGTEDLADLPGNDELRRAVKPAMAPDPGRG